MIVCSWCWEIQELSKCKIKTEGMIVCVLCLNCWDTHGFSRPGMKAGKGSWLSVSIVKSFEGKSTNSCFLLCICEQISRSSLAFIGRTAVSTKTDRTSKDLKDSEKQNMPHAPRILTSTSSALGLSMAEEQDLPNSRVHGADLGDGAASRIPLDLSL